MADASSFPIGSIVILQNLIKGTYNGLGGIVKSRIDPVSLRQNVFVADASKTIAIKPSNMKYHASQPAAKGINEKQDDKTPNHTSTPYEQIMNRKRKTTNQEGGGGGKKTKYYYHNGPFSCTVCGDRCNDSDFSCTFCVKGLCEKCCDRFGYDDKMLRCDGCGKTSCNSMGHGNGSCPKMIPDDGFYGGLPLCKECGVVGGV